MSCCVPGCKTSYWNKDSKGVSLFKALTDRQLRDWEEILRKKVGLEKFNKTDKICILHFKDDVIEREKTLFVRGGKVYKEKRKTPILSDFADPSVFSDLSKNCKHKKKETKDFCITNHISPEIFAQQKRIAHNDTSTVNSTVVDNEKKNRKVEVKKETDKVCDNNTSTVNCIVVENVKNNREVDSKKETDKACDNDTSTVNSTVVENGKNISVVDSKTETEKVCDNVVSNNSIKLKLGIKRKLDTSNEIDSKDLRTAKLLKSNNFYDDIINAINNKKIISKHLNRLWIANINNDECVSWSLWSEDFSKLLKRIVLFKDLKVNVYVNEKSIYLPEIDNIKGMAEFDNLLRIVKNINPCLKVNDAKCEENCLGFVKVNRNVGRPKLRCDPCNKLFANLKRRVSEAYKHRKVQGLGVLCNKLQKKNQRLKKKVNELKRNVKSLKSQCSKCDEKAVDKAISKLPFSEQMAVRACFNASKTTSLKGMRYETQWVYQCLLLRIKSRKAYEHLRKRRILVLPHVSTLNKYIKNISGCYGFQETLFQIMKEKTVKMKSSEVRGCLLIDEMKLSKALSFNRNKLKVEGFTDLGRYTPLHQRGKKGDHALVFMFQPFQGKWVQALACFLSTGSASGTVLQEMVIECIALSENAGLRVDVVTTDGASWNRNMWANFGISKENTSIPHVTDPKRRLWFVSDFPHLIKCMRNFFTHQRRQKDTGIWTPDGVVALKHWYALLKIEKEDAFNLKINFKLRREHLDPQYFQKMNVALAFQFFGVADAMEVLKNEHEDLQDAEPSITFCRRVKNLITAMNSRTPINNLKPDNEMWKAIEDFIEFLDNWESEAKKMKCDFLPYQTCDGLQISLRATLDICRFLVEKCNFSYLMTARLNQDSLERFFGLMRDCCGSNEHPDSTLFIQMYRLVSTYSLIKPAKGSNITGGEILDVLLSLKDVADVNERWEQWTGQIDTIIDKGINSEQLLDTTNLLQEHDYFYCTTSDYVLTYISGFVARKAIRFIFFNKKEMCNLCHSTLILGEDEEIPERHKLIQVKSHGYLKHPSIKLFDLISLLEQGTLQALRNNELNSETLFHVTEAIEKLPSPPLLGCCEHSLLLTQRIITFFLVTRMYFICKQENKNDGVEKYKTKEKRKLSKLSYAAENAQGNTDTVSNNFKSFTTEIALKPKRSRKKKLSDNEINNETGLNNQLGLPTQADLKPKKPRKNKIPDMKTNNETVAKNQLELAAETTPKPKKPRKRKAPNSKTNKEGVSNNQLQLPVETVLKPKKPRRKKIPNANDENKTLSNNPLHPPTALQSEVSIKRNVPTEIKNKLILWPSINNKMPKNCNLLTAQLLTPQVTNTHSSTMTHRQVLPGTSGVFSNLTNFTMKPIKILPKKI